MKFLPMGLGVSVICLTVAGQDSPKVQEPEYVNKYVLLQPDGSLKPLEQVESVIKFKTAKENTTVKEKILAVGRITQINVAVISGTKSPIRVATSPTPQFVVKVASRDYDPADSLHLYKEYTEEGERKVDISVMKSGGKDAFVPQDLSKKSLIPVTFQKYGEKSFKMTPQSPLAPGEYCLSTNNVADASCFGVD